MSPNLATDLHSQILSDAKFLRRFESDSFCSMFVLEVSKHNWFRFVDYSLSESDQVAMALQADPQNTTRFSKLYLARLVAEIRNTLYKRNETVGGWYHAYIYTQFDSNSWEVIEEAMSTLGWKKGEEK